MRTFVTQSRIASFIASFSVREPDATGKTFFAYVGPNQAEYVPARALTAPASKRVGDVRTTVSLRGVEVAGEFALSQADLNTLSGRDESNPVGCLFRPSCRAVVTGSTGIWNAALAWNVCSLHSTEEDERAQVRLCFVGKPGSRRSLGVLGRSICRTIS